MYENQEDPIFNHRIKHTVKVCRIIIITIIIGLLIFIKIDLIKTENIIIDLIQDIFNIII